MRAGYHFVQPSVQVTASCGKWDLAGKLGSRIALGGNASYTVDGTETGLSLLRKAKIDYDIGFGYAASFEASFPLGPVKLGGALEVVNLSLKPKFGTIEAFEVGGVDNTQGLSTSELEFNAVDELNENSNYWQSGNFDPDQPEDVLTEPDPFSSIGLNVFVAYTFN